MFKTYPFSKSESRPPQDKNTVITKERYEEDEFVYSYQIEYNLTPFLNEGSLSIIEDFIESQTTENLVSLANLINECVYSFKSFRTTENRPKQNDLPSQQQ